MPNPRLTINSSAWWVRPPPRPESIAFEDVTVIPMDTERTIPHQTVLVRDGWIRSIGRTGFVTLPPGTERIQGQGRYLMPGLADMHVHVSDLTQGLLYIANGVTTVRNMWGMAGLHLDAERGAQRGELLLPVLHTTGPITDGNPPGLPQYTIVMTADAATREVERQHDAGYTDVKVYNSLPLEAYQAIVNTARRLKMRVVGHVPVAVGIERAMAEGQYSIEHLTGFLWAGANMRTVAGWARDAGTWNCPTLTVLHQLASIQAAADRTQPELRYMARGILNNWRTRGDSGTTRLTLEAFGAVTRALRDEGAPLLLGSDTINPFVVPGFSIHEELRHLIAVGFTPFQAFLGGTRDAARFLQQQNEFGTVEAGKRADLILLDANPLADVANLKQRVGVMTRGVWLTEADLQARLDALAESIARGA